jgi:hypothetical protein
MFNQCLTNYNWLNPEAGMELVWGQTSFHLKNTP